MSRVQILAMGDDKWFDYFAAKRGDSVAKIAVAARTYAEALHNRSVNVGEKLPSWDRIRRWYLAVSEYGDAMFRIQSRNGDAMWTAVGAAQAVDMEELLDRLLHLEVAARVGPPPDVAAAGKRVLAHHDAISQLAKLVPEHPLTGINRIEVESLNIEGRKVLIALLPELVKTGGQEAYLVLVTCSKLSDPAVLFPPR
ncbi:MAG: hypothetical protein ACYC96_05255 [Fimbriimonadaceae bacterium]